MDKGSSPAPDKSSSEVKLTGQESAEADKGVDFSLLLGQEEVVEKVDQLISLVQKTNSKHFPHTLLLGDDEARKRVLSNYIAYKLGTKVVRYAASGIQRAGNLIGVLTNLGEGDILVVENIHRLRQVGQEFLYPAMKEFQIDFVIDQGPYAKTIKFELKKFTLIGTVTDESILDSELKSAFFCVYTIGYKPGLYSRTDLLRVLLKEVKSADVGHDEEALEFLANRYGDDPSRAMGILRKCIKYLEISSGKCLTKSLVQESVALMEHNAEQKPAENQARDRYISDEVKREVWRRDQGMCAKCSNRESLEYDHIIPLSKGGSSTARNIELLCEMCNRRKRDDI